jgi:hypothetical protein
VDQTAGIAVQVTMKLAVDFSVTGDAGSGTRAAWIASLLADLARSLSVDASRLNVTGLRPGSVIADVVLLPPPATSASSAGSWSPMTLSAPTLASRLAGLAADTSSSLYAAGAVTRFLDVSAAPLVFTSFATVSATYPFTAALGPALALSWRIQGNAAMMRLAYSGANGPTWFAFGFNDRAAMSGGDVVVFEPGKAAGSQLNQYAITSRASSGVSMVAAAAQKLSGVIATPGAGGAMTVEWTRPLAAGSYAGARAIPASGATYVLFAVGMRSQLTIGMHADEDAGSGQLDLSTGAFTASASRTAIIVAHGVVMFLAWGLLAPAGVLVARFTKHVQPADGPSAFWFTTHRIVQVTSMVLSVVGLVLAIVMVAPGPHFAEAHHIIGVVVVALGLLQPVNACCRPAKMPGKKRQSLGRTAWEWLHKGSGYAALLLAVVTVFLGLQEAQARAPYFAAYGALLAVGLCLALWRERIRRRGASAGKGVIAIRSSQAWSPIGTASPSRGYVEGGVELASPAGGGGQREQVVLHNPVSPHSMRALTMSPMVGSSV